MMKLNFGTDSILQNFLFSGLFYLVARTVCSVKILEFFYQFEEDRGFSIFMDNIHAF